MSEVASGGAEYAEAIAQKRAELLAIRAKPSHEVIPSRSRLPDPTKAPEITK